MSKLEGYEFVCCSMRPKAKGRSTDWCTYFPPPSESILSSDDDEEDANTDDETTDTESRGSQQMGGDIRARSIERREIVDSYEPYEPSSWKPNPKLSKKQTFLKGVSKSPSLKDTGELTPDAMKSNKNKMIERQRGAETVGGTVHCFSSPEVAERSRVVYGIEKDKKKATSNHQKNKSGESSSSPVAGLVRHYFASQGAVSADHRNQYNMKKSPRKSMKNEPDEDEWVRYSSSLEDSERPKPIDNGIEKNKNQATGKHQKKKMDRCIAKTAAGSPSKQQKKKTDEEDAKSIFGAVRYFFAPDSASPNQVGSDRHKYSTDNDPKKASKKPQKNEFVDDEWMHYSESLEDVEPSDQTTVRDRHRIKSNKKSPNRPDDDSGSKMFGTDASCVRKGIAKKRSVWSAPKSAAPLHVDIDSQRNQPTHFHHRIKEKKISGYDSGR